MFQETKILIPLFSHTHSYRYRQVFQIHSFSHQKHLDCAVKDIWENMMDTLFALKGDDWEVGNPPRGRDMIYRTGKIFFS